MVQYEFKTMEVIRAEKVVYYKLTLFLKLIGMRHS